MLRVTGPPGIDGAAPVVRDLPASTLDRVRRSRIADIVVAETRRSFVVAFDTLPELWEVSFDPDAPPIYDGLVHDWRSREAIPVPGFMNARRTPLPEGAVAPVARLSRPEGAWLLAQQVAPATSSLCSAVALIHLDVRRVVAQWRLAGFADVAQARPGTAAASTARAVFVLPVRGVDGRERLVPIEAPRSAAVDNVDAECGR